MLSYIRGILESHGEEYVVVDVGGIGYRIFVPTSNLERLPAVGSTVKIYTHLNVREDALLLYGFFSPEERELFELLITVTGIGPRVALGILSAMPVAQFKLALSQGDVKALTAIPGIGKKMAQRIVLELKDKITRIGWEAASSVAIADNPDKGLLGNAVEALINLGYSTNEATAALHKAKEELGDNADLEKLVRYSLKLLARL